jgi:5-formyltetrahydrofolate cyclo-ligase
MRALGFELSPGDFAENITTRGIELAELPLGTRLIVNTVELEVTQIGKECHAGCEIRKLVGDCIMPREGIFARVVSGGKIRPGDTIKVTRFGDAPDSQSAQQPADENRSDKDRKRAIRAEALAARRALTPEQASQKSTAILDRLRSLPEVESARALLVYVSSKDNEVDTLRLISSAIESGRKVLVPVAVTSTRKMVWSELRSLDELEPSTFSIMEPKEDCIRLVEHGETDAALVPGIAFDVAGHRIGYGGGYYDRFLASFSGKKVALAYELQVYESIPSEPHDLPVDVIATEDRIIKCR